MCCYVNSLVQVSHGPRPSTTKTINSWLLFVFFFFENVTNSKTKNDNTQTSCQKRPFGIKTFLSRQQVNISS